MTEQVWVGVACAAAAGLALVALVLALRAGRRAARAETLVRALTDRVHLLESHGADVPAPTAPAAPVAGTGTSYVITGMDAAVRERSDAAPPAPVAPALARTVDGRLFADIVARETVVKAASLTHGLRRALSPASRNRIRFEVRQETRRAGRDRRAETKQALREFRARERAARPVRDVGEDVA